MQFEGARRSGQAPNLTPLIDIVFLLLVYFMLTAHFVKDQGLPIELPEAESALSLEDQTPLEIKLTGTGQIMVADQQITIDLLQEYLRPLLAEKVEKRVLIRGDKDAGFGDSVKVIDAARLAGAAGVDIVTEQPDRP